MGQGAYILGCAGPRLLPSERDFFAEVDPWGFILFARNVANPQQMRALCRELRESVGRDAPILVDQEGGRVQRLTAPHWRQWLPPLDHVARSGEHAERSLYLRYLLIADELRAVGIDVNCAPTCDVAQLDTHPFLRNRCYGETPQTVAVLARAVANGLIDGGVAPVMKHIPGHGGALVDSHLHLPRVSKKLEELDDHDFEPFRALNDLPMAMSAHIVFETIDTAPATTSRDTIRIIRDRIGFDGLLMSDDLSMQALGGSIADRAGASMAAGCDLVLHCNGELDEMEAVTKVAGPLSAAAQKRADLALSARQKAISIDHKSIEVELGELMNGQIYV